MLNATFSRLTNPSVIPTGVAYTSTFSPDGVHLVLGHSTTPFITIYKRSQDTFTKLPNPSQLPEGSAINFAAFSPNGNFLALAQNNNTVGLVVYKRSGDTFTKLSTIDSNVASSCFSVAFSPDGTILAVGLANPPYMALYKVSEDNFAKMPNPNFIPSSNTRDFVFSPDGKFLIANNTSSPFMLVYKREGDTFTKIDAGGAIPPGYGRGSFTPDSKYYTVGHTGSPYLSLYKVNGDVLENIGSNIVANSATTASIFSPDGRFSIVTTGGNTVSFVAYEREGDVFTSSNVIVPTSPLLGTNYASMYKTGDTTYLALANTATPFLSLYKITYLYNNKILLSSGSKYYSIVDNILNVLPANTESMFLKYGSTNNVITEGMLVNKKDIVLASDPKENGKTYTHTINTSKKINSITL